MISCRYQYSILTHRAIDNVEGNFDGERQLLSLCDGIGNNVQDVNDSNRMRYKGCVVLTRRNDKCHTKVCTSLASWTIVGYHGYHHQQ